MTEMKDGIVQEGKTIREAVNRGLAVLGMPEGDVRVIVLDEGSRGIFWLFGARKARVQLIPAATREERARRIVDGLLGRMGLGGQVGVAISEMRIHVSIETADLDGLLIGRHGQTLDALEHLIDRMVNSGCSERRRVTVDVGGYRRRQRSGSRRRSSPQDKGRSSYRRDRSSGGRTTDSGKSRSAQPV
ncbi:MAG: Jag N-terminal domain-containing protein [Candidatus Eisenbacteria sp.]|nr:Jag N-terminal domain-containing protein [Candidatus Eisenbacteria bacterium]